MTRLNMICFCIGMVGVWEITHNWWAMLFAFIASIHFQMKGGE